MTIVHTITHMMSCVHGPNNSFENITLQMSESYCSISNMKSGSSYTIYHLCNVIYLIIDEANYSLYAILDIT